MKTIDINLHLSPETLAEYEAKLRDATRRAIASVLTDFAPDDSTNVKPPKTEGMNWEEAKAAMEGGACCARYCRFTTGEITPHRLHKGVPEWWVCGSWSKTFIGACDTHATDWRIVPDPSKPAEEAKPDPYPLTREQALDLLAGGKRVRHHGMDDGSYCTLNHRAEVVIKDRCDEVVNEYIEKSFLTATRWQVLD
jgi:hypothetical protein